MSGDREPTRNPHPAEPSVGDVATRPWEPAASRYPGVIEDRV